MNQLAVQPARASGRFAIGGDLPVVRLGYGLLARHDYDVEISGGAGAAHYVSDYDDVAGIRRPTQHRIFPRDRDGESLTEPLIVSIDLSEISFT